MTIDNEIEFGTPPHWKRKKTEVTNETLGPFDGSLQSLIQCYQTDPDSSCHKKRTRGGAAFRPKQAMNGRTRTQLHVTALATR
jgi:hypothetical protein